MFGSAMRLLIAFPFRMECQASRVGLCHLADGLSIISHSTNLCGYCETHGVWPMWLWPLRDLLCMCQPVSTFYFFLPKSLTCRLHNEYIPLTVIVLILHSQGLAPPTSIFTSWIRTETLVLTIKSSIISRKDMQSAAINPSSKCNRLQIRKHSLIVIISS